jgi:uncharacterized protein YceK
MRFAAVALIVVLVASGCGSGEDQTSPSQQTTTITQTDAPDSAREAAPSLSGASLDGATLALRDFRGRPVLINVWSSW